MRESAGLLLYHHDEAGRLVVLLGHMGGPLWARKDAGAWTIPKGEPAPGEDPHETAVREFAEEIGSPPPPGTGPDIDLGTVRQAGGKQVRAWARRADMDVDRIESNVFELVWPPRSGRVHQFPELDRAAWFTVERARELVIAAQTGLLERLAAVAADDDGEPVSGGSADDDGGPVSGGSADDDVGPVSGGPADDDGSGAGVGARS